MKRAKLDPEAVTRIVIMASMTPPSVEVTPDTELEARRADGLLDVGWHYLIDRNGQAHCGVPDDERGNLLPRYARTSIVIKLVGGVDEAGNPTKNFTPPQLKELRYLMTDMLHAFGYAKPALYRDLFKGVNPVINHEDY